MDLSSLHLSETGKQIIERTNTPENLLNLVSQAQVSFEMDFKNSRFHSNHFYTVGCIYYSKHYLRLYVAYRELIGGYGYAWNARIVHRYDYNSSDELKAAVIEFIAQNGGACAIDQTYIRNCINAAISPDTAQELWKTEKTSTEKTSEEFPELIKELKEIVAESKTVGKSYTEKEFQRDIERYHLDAFGLSSYTADDYSGAHGDLGGVSIRCTPEGDYEVYTVGERGTKERGTRCETRAEALYAAIHQALGQRSKIEYFERKSREERHEREKREQKAAKKNASKK